MSDDTATATRFIHRKFFCKTPTRLVCGAWRLCWTIYEVTEWQYGTSMEPVHTSTEFYSKKDLTMLKLSSEIIAFKDLVS